MKRGFGKRLAVWAMAVCMAGGISVPMHAEGLTAQDLQRKFPSGAFWNHEVQEGHQLHFSGAYAYDDGACNNPDGYSWHPCTNHWLFDFFPQEPGWYECNCMGSLQCYGFARKLGYDVYGSSFLGWPAQFKSMEGVKPGDIIHYYTVDEAIFGHQAMIIDVDGNRICLGENNWYDACQISWGRWMDVTDVAKYTIYSAPFELPGAGAQNLVQGKKGDVDRDGSRMLSDAQIILKGALRIEAMDEETAWLADVDGDGAVGLSDAQYLLKVALRIETMEDDSIEYNLTFDSYQLEYKDRWAVDFDEDEEVSWWDAYLACEIAKCPEDYEEEMDWVREHCPGVIEEIQEALNGRYKVLWNEGLSVLDFTED